MLTVKENAILVGAAELRKLMKVVLEEMKTHRVILTRRNKPVGMLVDYREFEKMEELINAQVTVYVIKVGFRRNDEVYRSALKRLG
jgi:prevent-host-death family protein